MIRFNKTITLEKLTIENDIWKNFQGKVAKDTGKVDKFLIFWCRMLYRFHIHYIAEVCRVTKNTVNVLWDMEYNWFPLFTINFACILWWFSAFWVPHFCIFLNLHLGCVCAHTTVVFVRMPCLITSVEVTWSVMEILRPSEWPYSGLERITTTSPYLRLPPQPQSLGAVRAGNEAYWLRTKARDCDQQLAQFW